MNHGALRKQYEIKHFLRLNLIFKNKTKPEKQNNKTQRPDSIPEFQIISSMNKSRVYILRTVQTECILAHKP